MSSNFDQIALLIVEVHVAAIERLERSTDNLVSTVVPQFLIESSSFLQVTRTTIKAGMSSNFDQIGLLTVELAAIERLEKSL